MSSLERLDLGLNALTSLELPGDMVALTYLDLTYNEMESLTLPDGFARPTTFNYFVGNRFPPPPDPKITGFTVLEQTEESTVVRLEWAAVAGLGYRAEVSQDLRQWREHQQSGSRWVSAQNRRPHFAPPTDAAQLDIELEGGLASVYVRIRGFDPASKVCLGHGCGVPVW